jgi:hypothetical protein
MAFQPLDPTTAKFTYHDRSRPQDPERRLPLLITPDGPRYAFRGPDDWAFFCHTPSAQDDPAPSGLRPYPGYRLGANAHGQVGWDPDWVLLEALEGGQDFKDGDFKACLARANPLVAHPSSLGPGGGKTLPFVILERTHSALQTLRRLSWLPKEALVAARHEGRSVVDHLVDRFLTTLNTIHTAPQSAHLDNLLLLAWALKRTQTRPTEVPLAFLEAVVKPGPQWKVLATGVSSSTVFSDSAIQGNLQLAQALGLKNSGMRPSTVVVEAAWKVVLEAIRPAFLTYAQDLDAPLTYKKATLSRAAAAAIATVQSDRAREWAPLATLARQAHARLPVKLAGHTLALGEFMAEEAEQNPAAQATLQSWLIRSQAHAVAEARGPTPRRHAPRS